jgi:RNA polymerase sigma-B factor
LYGVSEVVHDRYQIRSIGVAQRMDGGATVNALVVRRREERELFGRYAHGRDAAARDAIVERFLPLSRQLARRYRGLEDVEDLEQVAAIGLMKAIDRFDVDRGVAFSSFAFPTILGELRRHCRDLAWSVRVPRGLHDLVMRVERVADDLAGEFGRAPTVSELAGHTQATTEQVLEALQAVSARRAISLDRPRDDDDGPDIAGRDVGVEDTGFATVEDAAMLEDLMRVLPDRERLMLRLRFGEDVYQRQIGEALGLSQMHVSRVIHHSLERLRRAAESRL